MANDTIITVVGNLTADPELRFTPQQVFEHPWMTVKSFLCRSRGARPAGRV
jgi:single-stranded DNA-binding protein